MSGVTLHQHLRFTEQEKTFASLKVFKPAVNFKEVWTNFFRSFDQRLCFQRVNNSGCDWFTGVASPEEDAHVYCLVSLMVQLTQYGRWCNYPKFG